MDAHASCARQARPSVARLQFSLRSLLIVILLASGGLAIYRAFYQFTLVAYTGRNLDFAIRGPGYFIVTDENDQSRFYTREGRFWLDTDGILRAGTTQQRYYLHPRIYVPGDIGELAIASDGRVSWSCVADREVIPTDIGQIQIATFTDTEFLQEVSPGFFEPDGYTRIWHSPGQDGAGTIVQRWREVGRRADDIYAVLFAPALLVAFLLGTIVGTACICWRVGTTA